MSIGGVSAVVVGGGASALIVANPGPWRDGLQATLMEISQIKTIYLASDASPALLVVSTHRPALVLLDASLPGEEVCPLVEWLRAKWPQTTCLALVDDNQQRGKAKAAGADAVLVKGCPATVLFETLESLLPEQPT